MGKKIIKNKPADKTNSCVWMQAGVVRKKLCGIKYDCSACRFDRVLKHAADENRILMELDGIPKGKRGKIIFWKEKLKELPAWNRPCIHHMKRRIDFRVCTQDYRCVNCEFDQYFQDQFAVHAMVRPVDVIDIEGFRVPQGFYLHKGHAWAKIEEGSMVRLGLDDFALRMLGPLDRIEAPLIGKEMKQDLGDIVLNRGKNKAKVLSPVSGVVTDVNPRLRDRGKIANEDPYSKGWVVRVHSKNLRQDMKNLMLGNETEDFLKQEVDHLYQVIEEEIGPLAADGGNLRDDIYGHLPQIGWENLTKQFLRT